MCICMLHYRSDKMDVGVDGGTLLPVSVSSSSDQVATTEHSDTAVS